MAQADQRVDGQIKGTVHPYPSFTSSSGPVDDAAEVVDALIPQRQQLLCGILAAAAAAAVDQQRGFLIGQRLGHFAPDALVGDKDGVFNMPAVVFLPGADIHHHDLLRGHHLIGFLGADLMIRRLVCHVLRRVRFLPWTARSRSAAQARRQVPQK